jgi:hypothetical protein
MNRAIALAGLVSLVMLAACSKPAATDDEEMQAGSPVVKPDDKPKMARADYLTSLLGTVDTTPQCQPFRDQLEQVRDASSDALSPAEMNQANEIAGKSYAAGCLVKQ